MYGMRRSASCAEHGRDLRHLHERQHALLHARAAGRRDDDERVFAFQRPLGEARDLLADDGSHRAAHEREVHHAGIHREVVERPCARQQRVGLADFRRRLLEARRILGKAERVGRAKIDLHLLHRPFIQQQGAILGRPNAAMVVAVRAHVHVARELFTDVRVSARFAFFPDVSGDLESLSPRLPGLFVFLVPPSHGGNLGVTGSLRLGPRPPFDQTFSGPARPPRPSLEMRASKPTDSQHASMNDPP